MKEYKFNNYNNLKRQFFFETLSLLGRTFRKRKSKIPIDKKPVFLDFGVGENYTDGWIHIDFYQLRFKFWKKAIKLRKPEVEMDLRYKVNCPDNVIDGVYSCHTLEHLDPDDAIKLLKEILRILKPNCYLRIIVPDIKIAIDFYNGKNNALQFQFGCEAIADFTQNWGHRSTWDEQFLSHILNEIGFVDIKKVKMGEEGTDRRLIKDNMNRNQESLVIEAKKPLL